MLTASVLLRLLAPSENVFLTWIVNQEALQISPLFAMDWLMINVHACFIKLAEPVSTVPVYDIIRTDRVGNWNSI